MIEITKKDIELIIPLGEKEGLSFCNNTKYYGLYKNGILVAISGILSYKNKYIFKNHYVFTNERGKGYFKEMLNFLLSNYKGKIEATCTKMSIREYLKRGFKPIKKFKNGCIKVEYENL